MLKRIRRWLGWEGDSSWLDLRPAPRPAKSREQPPPPPKAQPAPAARRREQARAQPPRSDRPKKSRDPLDLLSNPKLTLDKPADDGFDPYNTGAFNRSASWDKIGRQRKR